MTEHELPCNIAAAPSSLLLAAAGEGGHEPAGLTPLALMHGILRDTASRLLCAEAILSARAAAAAGSRWHKQLSISAARTLSNGMRCAFPVTKLQAYLGNQSEPLLTDAVRICIWDSIPNVLFRLTFWPKVPIVSRRKAPKQEGRPAEPVAMLSAVPPISPLGASLEVCARPRALAAHAAL